MSVQRFHIATCADSNYYVPLYVMLHSLFKNNNAAFNVYILYTGYTDKQKKDVEQLAKTSGGHQIIWLSINNPQDASTFKTELPPYYYRIFLQELLPAEITTILYLDSDLIILKDITELFDIDISSFAIMGVKDVSRYNMKRLHIPEKYDYINAGVLLLNVEKWRKNNYLSQLIDNIRDNGKDYWLYDQDALNALLYADTYYLHPRYNHLTSFYHVDTDTLQKRYGVPVNEFLRAPSIVHFATSIKPWHYLSTHPFKLTFLEYLAETPFIDFAEKGTTRLWLKKLLMRIKHKIA